ncbi:coagulation factor 5/8 type domain-containing protein [Pedobacter yulinensis]|uniref:Coagulation factor 5/8 type domain-containing protein n=1 Tax=Pedobacter yulinensis TaxID=2126353 RepID=A0A2T3HKH6_9SPHI|nr:glycosyl hydrolase family 28-related protein [Pedobacter yulinensis]PST82891.1 coagulation factor 5/8 type domain-containing protein [Pedobacter yulinensis]
MRETDHQQLSFRLCALLCLLPFAVFSQAQVVSYPLPPIYRTSAHYTLKAGGTPVPVTACNGKYDYAHFSMAGRETEIRITVLKGWPSRWRISPARTGICAKRKGSDLVFNLPKDAYLIIKLNNLPELVIAADPLEKDVPPPAGSGIFNVADRYHADQTGKTLATAAVQKAIDDAAAFRNGTVYVPPGVYKLGNLKLKSNTRVYLAGGAVFLFSGRREDYTIHARKKSQNRDLTWWISTDSGAHDIKLFGRGTLDGNGKYATETGRVGNHILAIMHGNRFVLDGLVIRESGAWAVIPTRSKNIRLKNFKLFNRFDMGENDGVDVMESRNVRIEHAIGIALDDPFSTKTWEQDTDLCRNWPGRPLPQRNILFRDLLSWTYCYGYKIGQGVLQPQQDITFKDCVVYDAAVGIGVHHKWGTQPVTGVRFRNIEVERLSYQNDDHRTWGVFFMQNGDKKGSGPIAGLSLENIRIYDAGRSPAKLKGLSQQRMVSRVRFRNVRMPAAAAAAKTLKEMNVTDTAFVTDIKILTR